MGQSKSKTWRRLSESDCSHLMTNNNNNNNRNSHHGDLGPMMSSHESNLHRHSHLLSHSATLPQPLPPQPQSSSPHRLVPNSQSSLTLSNQKLQRRLSHLYPLQGSQNASGPGDNEQAPTYESICGTQPDLAGQQPNLSNNKTPTLTRYNRLDSNGCSTVTLRNTSTTGYRQSTLGLPRPPSPIITTISDQISANQQQQHQIPNRNYRRLINSVCLLTGDRLDRARTVGTDSESSTEDEDDYSSLNDPSTPPPSYMDQCFSTGPSRTANCVNQLSLSPKVCGLSQLNPPASHMTRPISMFQFEPATTTKPQPSPTALIRNKGKYPEPPGKPPSIRATAGQAGPSKFHRLSLSDILERLNSFEECAQFDEQNTPVAQTPEGDSGSDQVPAVPTSGGTSSRVEQAREESQNSRKQQQMAVVRCSGLDCMCDRCMGQRFKLLNWLLPNCTRINAERLLYGRLDGTFLVRKSEKFPGQYTLSFVCKRTVRHCLIMRSVYGFGLRWPYSFETLQQVIAHYARHSLIEFNSKLDVRLRYPVFMIGT